jgi:hypothetical protein
VVSVLRIQRWGGTVVGVLILADLGYLYSQIQERIATLSNTENQFQLALARTVSPGIAFGLMSLGALLLLLSAAFFEKPVMVWNPTKIYSGSPSVE